MVNSDLDKCVFRTEVELGNKQNRERRGRQINRGFQQACLLVQEQRQENKGKEQQQAETSRLVTPTRPAERRNYKLHLVQSPAYDQDEAPQRTTDKNAVDTTTPDHTTSTSARGSD